MGRERTYKIVLLIGKASDSRLERIENKGGPLSDYATEELYKRHCEDFKRVMGVHPSQIVG